MRQHAGPGLLRYGGYHSARTEMGSTMGGSHSRPSARGSSDAGQGWTRNMSGVQFLRDQRGPDAAEQ